MQLGLLLQLAATGLVVAAATVAVVVTATSDSTPDSRATTDTHAVNRRTLERRGKVRLDFGVDGHDDPKDV